MDFPTLQEAEAAMFELGSDVMSRSLGKADVRPAWIVIGYAGNADRFETYSTYPTPTQDSQQPLINLSPLNGYPLTPAARNITNGVFITGQVPGASGGYQAVHTASDIPVSAFGRGASKFTGVMENTDVFFKAMQAALGGATNP
jgi:alkaline phosphatase